MMHSKFLNHTQTANESAGRQPSIDNNVNIYVYDHVCEFINDNWIHGNLKNYCGDWSFLVFMLSTESTVQEMTQAICAAPTEHGTFPIELLPKPMKQHSNSSSGRRSRRDTERDFTKHNDKAQANISEYSLNM